MELLPPPPLSFPHSPSPSEPTPVVLVVDDNEPLRRLLQLALPRQGFTVWVAANGYEALDIYRDRHEEISVVLMDVRMPGLDGPETLAALRETNNNVRCCFMSGFLGDFSEDDLLERGAALVFSKPFALKEMCQALWQVIGQPPPSTPIRFRPAA